LGAVTNLNREAVSFYQNTDTNGSSVMWADRAWNQQFNSDNLNGSTISLPIREISHSALRTTYSGRSHDF